MRRTEAVGCYLLIVMLFAACGSYAFVPEPVVVKPLSVLVLDSASIAWPFQTRLVSAGQGSVLAITEGLSTEIQLSRYDEKLNLLWTRVLSFEPKPRIDDASIHSENGKLFIPLLQYHSNKTASYELYTLNISNGVVLDSLTLMRFNEFDQGKLDDRFERNAQHWSVQQAKASWSPDSSKFILFKYYPSGGTRFNMELMLFKRGFSLATKTNIDFRLDTNHQSLLSIQLDNDGVAYLYLSDDRDSSFEVGRFEILGSKQLRTIKYKSPIVPYVGRVAIAPRGHAYLATLSQHENASKLALVDFDFYQNVARVKERVVSRPPVTHVWTTPFHIFVSANANRIITGYDDDASRQQVLRSYFYAYDLDLNPAWESSLPTKMELHGRHGFLPATHQMEGSIGYFAYDKDTLRFEALDLETGKQVVTPEDSKLLYVKSLEPLAMNRAILRGKRVYLIADKLYGFTLP